MNYPVESGRKAKIQLSTDNWIISESMVIISYDISNDKLRTRFSNYLCKFGHRIQYSVFEIENSKKLLDNIICDINNNFSKKFSETDSVYIFNLSTSCEVLRYGFAKHEEDDIFFI